jgi:hypothetical protein
VTRERGVFHQKVSEAIIHPLECMSLSLDGTNQMPSGYPHFFESTKADAGGSRLNLHTEIVVVDGHAPHIFVAHEDIRGDPNLTIKCLQDTLKHAEAEIYLNGLPETLYIQLDNYFRENKNTYVFSYLCWLVERGVFTQIFVSYLPTGHTHFPPDQVASRIAEYIRYRDVKTIDDYLGMLRVCYTPSPIAHLVDDVYDFKELFNPGCTENEIIRHTFPVSSSRVRRARGIGTKVMSIPAREYYMGETSALHWRFRRYVEDGVLQKKAMVQAKFTCDDADWSQPFFPWNEKASRPENRFVEPGYSGLLPRDVKLAPNNPLVQTRAVEVKGMLKAIKDRLSDEENSELDDLYKRVTTARAIPSMTTWEVEKAMQFLVDTQEEDKKDEDNDDSDDNDENENDLLIRPTTLFVSLGQQNYMRRMRRERGHASIALKVGNFIAYTTNYTPATEMSDRQDFWLGKIQKIEDAMVEFRAYHTGTKKNLTAKNPSYKLWTGNPKVQWIPVRRVLETFEDLTGRGKKVPEKIRRKIGNSLKLWQTNQENSSNVVGVGADSIENEMAPIY